MMMQYNNRSLFLCVFLALLSAITTTVVVQSFSTPQTTKLTSPHHSYGRTSSPASPSQGILSSQTPHTQLFMGGVDPSKSGTKTGRMKQLAEMEKLGSKDDGDKSVFIKAALGGVAFVVIAIGVAAASGLLTQY
mmetsp:Transcript_45421/g.50925  ORF Transcript_45421/g.50925 Transcript_45421/m.50925 type:complete len:134 (-) Transcript_45421:458-859(-)